VNTQRQHILSQDTFRFEIIGGRAIKIKAEVAFPEELDVKPFLCSTAEEHSSTIYRLTGIVEHQGTMHGGHYVAYVRNPDGTWSHISDDSVVDCKDIAKAQPFLLFYALA